MPANLLVGWRGLVREHGHQVLHVLELARAAGPHDVVACSHALDAVATHVRVRDVGAKEHGLPRRENHNVQHKHTEAPDVTCMHPFITARNTTQAHVVKQQ